MVSLSKYNEQGEEITRGEFKSHVWYYLRELRHNREIARPDDFLVSFGLTGPVLLKLLLDADIVSRRERIISPKTPEDGYKDKFAIKYDINREDYTGKMNRLYDNVFSGKRVNESRVIREDGECGLGGATAAANCNNSAPIAPLTRQKPISKGRGRTFIITKEQAEMLEKALVNEDSPAVMDTKFGNFGYDAPGLSIGNDDPTMNHRGMMRKGWRDGQ